MKRGETTAMKFGDEDSRRAALAPAGSPEAHSCGCPGIPGGCSGLSCYKESELKDAGARASQAA